MIPRIGNTFQHAKWLNEYNQPAKCQITKIAQGVVYFKFDGEQKAKHYIPIEQFKSIVKA